MDKGPSFGQIAKKYHLFSSTISIRLNHLKLQFFWVKPNTLFVHSYLINLLQWMWLFRNVVGFQTDVLKFTHLSECFENLLSHFIANFIYFCSSEISRPAFVPQIFWFFEVISLGKAFVTRCFVWLERRYHTVVANKFLGIVLSKLASPLPHLKRQDHSRGSLTGLL